MEDSILTYYRKWQSLSLTEDFDAAEMLDFFSDMLLDPGITSEALRVFMIRVLMHD